MYWQREYIRESDSATRDATYKLDLPDNGLMGTLMLRLEGKKAAGNPLGSVAKWRLIDEIDKIEVIANGSEVIKSITGTQLQFGAFLDQGVVVPAIIEEYSSAYNRIAVPINFGREMYDKQLGLDLSRFNSVELQITNSCSTSHWHDSLSWTTLAYWLRDQPSAFQGYMRSEEWRSWTTVADETRYFDLPTGLPLRRIILQAWPDLDSDEKEESSPYDLMDDIELNLRTGQVRVYKGGFDDLARENVLDLGVFPFGHGVQYHATGKGFYSGVGRAVVVLAGQTSKESSVSTTPSWLSAQENWGTQFPKNYQADIPSSFLALGYAYMNCVVFRFDHDPSPGAWLNPDQQKTVELNIHTKNDSSAADATNSVVLDRLVRY